MSSCKAQLSDIEKYILVSCKDNGLMQKIKILEIALEGHEKFEKRRYIEALNRLTKAEDKLKEFSAKCPFDECEWFSTCIGFYNEHKDPRGGG